MGTWSTCNYTDCSTLPLHDAPPMSPLWGRSCFQFVHFFYGEPVRLSRRDILQATAAAAVIMGVMPRLGAAATSQKITQADLLRFQPLGQVTLLHFTDIHAQQIGRAHV